MVERAVDVGKVTGSNPVSPTTKIKTGFLPVFIYNVKYLNNVHSSALTLSKTKTPVRMVTDRGDLVCNRADAPGVG